MVESVWCIICETTNTRDVVLVSESSWDELEIIFKIEVLGLFVDHLLIPSDTSDCHLDADHHI